MNNTENDPPDLRPPDTGGPGCQENPKNVTSNNQFPNLPKATNIYNPNNQLNGLRKDNFTRYLQIDFDKTERKSVNPYKIQNEITEKTGHKPAELTGNNKTKLTIKTINAKQTEMCLKMTKLAGTNCTITPHPRFNSCQGLIFARDYNYKAEDIRDELSDEYGVTDAKEATFIKGRQGSTAYILTFNREATPYVVSIPGERTDSVVSPFLSKPMMCKKCLAYGHTQKKCRKDEPRCKKCSEEGHELKDCQSQTTKCHHCKENHQAGSKDCKTQNGEQQILQTVEKQKVTFQRARQINECKPIIRTVTAKTPMTITKFDIEWPKGTKRNTNPWQTQRCIEKHTGKKPRSIRSKPNEEDTLVVEVSTHAEAVKLSALTQIEDLDVKITPSNTQNLPRGIVFIEGYDMMEFEEYKNDLMNQYKLTKVEQAHWINSRNPALILTFSQELPDYLDIPGESKRTVVLEYKRQPNLCRKCLNYGHPKKVCREQERCENCTSTDHSTSGCRLDPKCLHCKTNHKTGSKNCQAYKVEEEIVAIQEKSAVKRSQAVIIYNQEHPQSNRMNFAAAAAPPKPTTTNSEPIKVTPSTSNNITTTKEIHSAPTNSGHKPGKKKKPNITHNQNEKELASKNRFDALRSLDDYESEPEPLEQNSTLTPETQQNSNTDPKSFRCISPSGREYMIENPQMLTEDEKTSRNCPEIHKEVKKIFNDFTLPTQPTDNERISRREREEKERKKRKPSTSRSTERAESKRSCSEIRRSGSDYAQNSYHSRSRSPLKNNEEIKEQRRGKNYKDYKSENKEKNKNKKGDEKNEMR